MSTMPIFTIGHSNRAIEAFTGLLRGADVDLLVDVRAYPNSRYSPQFGKVPLSASLEAAAIAYRHLPVLGGMRPDTRPDSPNGMWQGAFRSYADYALTPPFRAGLDTLIGLSREHIVAIMCAEADWHHCHRQIITDYLLAAGIEVRHIVNSGTEPAHLNQGARPQADGSVLYPPLQASLF
jgi:uncharacterized protein (DUF488 family)